MRPTRNWTTYATYVPESESALRKKCIELSPSFPLSSSTSKVSAVSRCNQSNNQIKDTERNGMKNNLRKSNDSVNKVADHFGDDNDAIVTLSSTTKPKDTPLKSSTDRDFENSVTANSIHIDADCDKSNTNLERAPLIQLSPNKSITLVKQNSTSLIFTKKDVNPVVHRKRITLVRSSGTHSASEITAKAASPTEELPIGSNTDDFILSPKKRHSFHWHTDPNSGNSADKSKRKQIKSWYAVIGSPSVKESTFDSDTEVFVKSYIYCIFFHS